MIVQYALGHNAQESERLNTQAHLLTEPSLLDLTKNARSVLEIGCGVGSNEPLLRKVNPSLRYVGIDSSPTAIRIAQKEFEGHESKAQFFVMDAKNLNFPDQHFDLVLCKLVLWSLVPYISEVISEAHRVLKNEGIFYSFEPCDSHVLFSPPKPFVERLIREWRDESKNNSADPSIGPNIHSALVNQGFKETHVQFFAVSATSDEESKYKQIMENLSNFYLGSGAENPSQRLSSYLKKKAAVEFKSQSKNQFVMDAFFVSVGRKVGE